MDCLARIYLTQVNNILSDLVLVKCFGCGVNSPSQRDHDVCLFMSIQEQFLAFYDEVIPKLNEIKIQEALNRNLGNIGGDLINELSLNREFRNLLWTCETWKELLLSLL